MKMKLRLLIMCFVLFSSTYSYANETNKMVDLASKDGRAWVQLGNQEKTQISIFLLLVNGVITQHDRGFIINATSEFIKDCLDTLYAGEIKTIATINESVNMCIIIVEAGK